MVLAQWSLKLLLREQVSSSRHNIPLAILLLGWLRRKLKILLVLLELLYLNLLLLLLIDYIVIVANRLRNSSLVFSQSIRLLWLSRIYPWINLLLLIQKMNVLPIARDYHRTHRAWRHIHSIRERIYQTSCSTYNKILIMRWVTCMLKLLVMIPSIGESLVLCGVIVG